MPKELNLVSDAGDLVLNIFPMLCFAVKGTFEQVFVIAHQFYFGILLSEKAVLGNLGSIFCSYSLRQGNHFTKG